MTGIETAAGVFLASYPYPPSRCLDRITQQIERLEHHVKISNEAIPLFVLSGVDRNSLPASGFLL